MNRQYEKRSNNQWNWRIFWKNLHEYANIGIQYTARHYQCESVWIKMWSTIQRNEWKEYKTAAKLQWTSKEKKETKLRHKSSHHIVYRHNAASCLNSVVKSESATIAVRSTSYFAMWNDDSNEKKTKQKKKQPKQSAHGACVFLWIMRFSCTISSDAHVKRVFLVYLMQNQKISLLYSAECACRSS